MGVVRRAVLRRFEKINELVFKMCYLNKIPSFITLITLLGKMLIWRDYLNVTAS